MPDRSTMVNTRGSSVAVGDPASPVYVALESSDRGVKLTNVSSDTTKLLCYQWFTAGSGATTSSVSNAWGSLVAGEVEFLARPGSKYSHLVYWYETVAADRAVTCLFD